MKKAQNINNQRKRHGQRAANERPTHVDFLHFCANKTGYKQSKAVGMDSWFIKSSFPNNNLGSLKTLGNRWISQQRVSLKRVKPGCWLSLFAPQAQAFFTIFLQKRKALKMNANGTANERPTSVDFAQNCSKKAFKKPLNKKRPARLTLKVINLPVFKFLGATDLLRESFLTGSYLPLNFSRLIHYIKIIIALKQTYI